MYRHTWWQRLGVCCGELASGRVMGLLHKRQQEAPLTVPRTHVREPRSRAGGAESFPGSGRVLEAHEHLVTVNLVLPPNVM